VGVPDISHPELVHGSCCIPSCRDRPAAAGRALELDDFWRKKQPVAGSDSRHGANGSSNKCSTINGRGSRTGCGGVSVFRGLACITDHKTFRLLAGRAFRPILGFNGRPHSPATSSGIARFKTETSAGRDDSTGSGEAGQRNTKPGLYFTAFRPLRSSCKTAGGRVPPLRTSERPIHPTGDWTPELRPPLVPLLLTTFRWAPM
jgi:hypothetical protein